MSKFKATGPPMSLTMEATDAVLLTQTSASSNVQIANAAGHAPLGASG